MAKPEIKGAIRLNQKEYVAGQEKDLLAVSTEEQRKAWLKRGLIEGDWGVEVEEETPAADAVTDEQLEPIAARIAEALDVERNEDETPLQFLERFSGECEQAIERVGERVEDLEGQLKAANEAAAKDRSALEGERDAANLEAQRLREELAALKAKAPDGGTPDAAGDGKKPKGKTE